MSAEKFRQTTERTQEAFLQYRQNVLSPAVFGGPLPNNRLLKRLSDLLEQHSGSDGLALLNRLAIGYKPLGDIISQYIDAAGEPKVAVNDNGKVKLVDTMACFGRSCGFAEICWTSCSLGPSRTPDGSLPPGASEGEAIPRHPSGYALGEEPLPGVLCAIPDPQSGQARHRSDACAMLSLFCHVFGIPPAPTGSIADAIYDQVAPTLDHVEARLAENSGQAQPQAAPTIAMPAPPAAPPSAPQQSAPPAPPSMFNGAPPSAPPAGPPAAPQQPAPPVPPSAPPVPPQAGPPPQAPPVPPTTAQAAPQQPAAPQTPTIGAAGTPGPDGVPHFFDNTTLEQEWELRALCQALLKSPVKPMSENALNGLIERNKDKYKTLRSALFKAAAGRGLTTGTSLKADKLLKEHWHDVEIPEGYFDKGVPEETSSAPPAVAGPPTAPPAGNVIKLQPQAAPEPRQRVDVEIETGQEQQRSTAPSAKEPEEVPQANPKVQPLLEGGAGSSTVELLETLMPGLLHALADKITVGLHEMAEAYRERTALLRAQAHGVVQKPSKKVDPQPPVVSEEQEPTPAKKKRGRPPKSAQTTNQLEPVKKPSFKRGRKSSATSEGNGHPKNPKVQAEPLGWQPGRRGRPPKGVKRLKNGVYKFPAGFAEIDGLWHGPLK